MLKYILLNIKYQFPQAIFYHNLDYEIELIELKSKLDSLNAKFK